MTPFTLLHYENGAFRKSSSNRRIWKRNFISTVRPTVHTHPSQKQSISETLLKPKESENATLFLRLELPSTLIRHENGTFRKRSLIRRNLETAALHFSVNGKHFSLTRSFSKTMASRHSFPARVLHGHKSKMTGDCCFSKFLRSVNGKHMNVVPRSTMNTNGETEN